MKPVSETTTVGTENVVVTRVYRRANCLSDAGYIADLETAVLALWAELDGPQLALIREEQPEVLELAGQLHERRDHPKVTLDNCCTWCGKPTARVAGELVHQDDLTPIGGACQNPIRGSA